MGAVPAHVVIATFFNFNPALVRRSLPEAWERATPAATEKKKTPVAADAGVIVEWPSIADRMIEEMR